MTRRAMFAVFALIVAVYDLATVLPIGIRVDPGIAGWASLLLTDGTVGPIFAISVFQLLVLLAALAFPNVTAEQPVRVALTLSIMNALALTSATAISSGGASLIVLGAVALSATALIAIHAASARFTLGASIIIGGLLLSLIGIGPLLIGAGTAITGAATALFLLETREDRRPANGLEWRATQ